MVLEKINQVGDIKQIPPEEYDTLAEEIRHFLVEKISREVYDATGDLELRDYIQAKEQED